MNQSGKFISLSKAVRQFKGSEIRNRPGVYKDTEYKDFRIVVLDSSTRLYICASGATTAPEMCFDDTRTYTEVDEQVVLTFQN